MSFWDQRYGSPAYFYGTEPNEFLRAHAAAFPPGGAVLCLGEGEGRNAVFLAAQGHDVVALDQSAVGLEKAARLADTKGVRIRTLVADLANFPVEPGRWDGIVSIWCHLPSAMRRALHRQVIVSLKPGGVFLLEAYTPEQLRYGTGGPRETDLLPSLAELRRDLDGMELLVGLETEREVQEGTGHHGLSAVVQVIARRPPR